MHTTLAHKERTLGCHSCRRELYPDEYFIAVIRQLSKVDYLSKVMSFISIANGTKRLRNTFFAFKHMRLQTCYAATLRFRFRRKVKVRTWINK